MKMKQVDRWMFNECLGPRLFTSQELAMLQHNWFMLLTHAAVNRRG
jgi:hypothetical protein